MVKQIDIEHISLNIQGHGTVDKVSNMYIGQDAAKSHSAKFIKDQTDVFCSVLPHKAGVLVNDKKVC